MTAYFIARMRVKNPRKMGEYGAGARASIRQYGGEMVFRGNRVEVLAGNCDADAVVVARFPDLKTLNEWNDSPEYQALIPLRDEAVDMVMVSYERP